MPPTIITQRLFRLEKSTGIQITATIRPDLKRRPDQLALREKIERLIKAGTSHFRLNLSHFIPEDQKALKKLGLTENEYRSRWSDLVRCIDSLRDLLKANVFIMLDTAGPEFRIERAAGGNRPLNVLEQGKEYLLSAEDGGSRPELPTVYLTMPAGFRSFGEQARGKEISFKDGDCTATVVAHLRPKVIRIKTAHRLRLSAGQHIKVNLPDFDLHGINSLGRWDSAHIKFFLTIPQDPKSSTKRGSYTDLIPVDYVAQSFVRRARDIADLEAILNNLVAEYGAEGITKPLIIPKIETAQAVDRKVLRKIASNRLTAAIMVARGDLGSECKRWMIPSKQREIVRMAHAYLKPVLVATEVYGSMGKHPKEAWQPNRGEVLDLRHALEAGVDGIVFSAETGARPDPETTVEFAVKQAHEDEKDMEKLDLHEAERNSRRERLQFGYAKRLKRPIRTRHFDDPLPFDSLADFSTMDWACAAVYRANTRGAAGVFPFTVEGNTVRDMVHFLPYRPIVALTDNRQTLAKVALFAHVHPVLVAGVDNTFDIEDLKKLVEAVINKFGMRKFGKEALATMPHPIRRAGGTDTLVRILL